MARILVIDDNLDSVQSMAFLLRDMRHEVEFAITARAALEAARRFRPDYVFIDLGLPDMDGAELARRLRAEPGIERARFFALTGSGREEDRARALEAGCDQYLVKPLEPQFLESVLKPRR
jgi:CheY-like chemotaxis protein